MTKIATYAVALALFGHGLIVVQPRPSEGLMPPARGVMSVTRQVYGSTPDSKLNDRLTPPERNRIKNSTFDSYKSFQASVFDSSKFDSLERLVICSELNCIEGIGVATELAVEGSYQDVCKAISHEYPTPSTVTIAHTHPLRNLDASKIYPPAPDDIIMHALIKDHFQERQSITSEVYDGYGVWTYDTNTELQNQLIEGILGEPGLGGMALAIHWAFRLDTANNNPAWDRNQRINYLVEEGHRLGIMLNYRPLEP